MNILTSPINAIQSAQKVGGSAQANSDQKAGFGDLLQKAIDEVNTLQQQSDDLKTQLVTGQLDDIHQVMIAAEKADLAFQLTVQIRNKVLDAYQEIMRMQV